MKIYKYSGNTLIVISVMLTLLSEESITSETFLFLTPVLLLSGTFFLVLYDESQKIAVSKCDIIVIVISFCLAFNILIMKFTLQLNIPYFLKSMYNIMIFILIAINASRHIEFKNKKYRRKNEKTSYCR